jgi:AraC-like DNA-binding protein
MKELSSIMLLVAGAQGVLLSVALVLSQYKKSIAAAFLGCIIFVCSIELLNAWAIPTGYHSRSGAFPFWLLGSYWIIPAALWCFVRLNAVSVTQISRNTILLFVPAFIEITVEFFVFYRHRFTGPQVNLMEIRAWVIFTEYLPVAAMIFVMLVFGKKIAGQFVIKKISERPSDRPIKEGILFLLFSLFTILWSAEVFFHTDSFGFTSAVIALFLMASGYIIYFKPDFFSTAARVKTTPGEDAFSIYNDAIEMQRILGRFEQGKIHLRPRLTLEELSAGLSLPERYVSHLINKNAGVNFSQFVNTYRVREFLERVKDTRNQNKTLLGIALESGFNSKSTFNQIFKTITGTTPSSYLANSSNESENTIPDVRN